MFSRIASGFQGPTNPLYRLRTELQSRGHPIRDLVSGNVNEHGIVFPEHLLREILIQAAAESGSYRPDSLGQSAARIAVSSYYERHGPKISPENILLTPGTSVSYWYLFKLLCNEGEEILAPRPSYPLFEYIAALSGARMLPYPLAESRGWSVDLDRLEGMVSTLTRAIILISPHNPTGHVSAREEIEAVAAIARHHDLAIISDEVFSEFLLHDEGLPRAAFSDAPLVFTLNGFSKMFALPGLKLGWVAVSGDEPRVRAAMTALEMISDTFLPVNEIVQSATPSIFARGNEFLESYRTEIRGRWETARMILSESERIQIIEPAGGFHVTARLKEVEEEKAAEALLEKSGILVHPGHFYDMEPDHLVFTYVLHPEILKPTLNSMRDTLEKM